MAFMEPRSIASAEDEGFAVEEIEEALAAGLILDEEEYVRLELWERAGWSRPAYLMFSQMNLEYVESSLEARDLEAFNAERRATVEQYELEYSYPSPQPLATGSSCELPEPSEIALDLRALESRRSVRAFARQPPSREQLGDILYSATRSHRMIAADRASGDRFRLLNSLYSWAHLFVVVQEVDGLPRGAFEYDWRQHRLLRSAEPATDEDMLVCVQGQRWVLGPGFAVFVVADLRGYAWLYRHSRAYIHVLIQVGELGQEILMASTKLGLGGWLTPAVHESHTAAVLGLPEDDGIEVLSMVKLGRPLRRRTG